LVTRQAFLKLIDVRAEANSGEETRALPLNDLGEHGDEKAFDGRYAMRFDEPRPRQEVEVLVAVDSPTFMREKRFRLAVHEPLSAAVDSGTEGLTLNVAIEAAVMQPGAVVDAWQETVDGRRQGLPLNTAEPGRLSAAVPDGTRPVYVKFSGTTRLGNLVGQTLGPLAGPGMTVPPPVEPTPPAVAVEENVQEVAVQPEPQPQEEASWLVVAVVFGGFNLVLIIAGGLWYFLKHRRGDDLDDLDLEQLMETQLAAPAPGDSPRQENAA
jgi:hypothetical protein